MQDAISKFIQHCFNLALMVGIPDKECYTELWIKTMQQQEQVYLYRGRKSQQLQQVSKLKIKKMVRQTIMGRKFQSRENQN